MTAPLLPCPFCGGADIAFKTHESMMNDKPIYQGFAECWECGGRGPQTAWYDDNDGAKSKAQEMVNDEGWNARARGETPAPLQENGEAA